MSKRKMVLIIHLIKKCNRGFKIPKGIDSPNSPENKISEVGRFAFEPTGLAFAFISKVFRYEKLKSTAAICIIAAVPLWRREQDSNPRGLAP